MTPIEPQPQSQQAKPAQSRIKRAFTALRAWFTRNKWAGTVLTALLIIIPVYFLGHSLWTNWQTLTSAEIEIDWGRMALSLAILMVAFALFPSGTLIGLRGMGARVTYGQAYYGYHASQLGKYIPGRIWIIPGRAVTLRRFGVDGVTAAASALIDMYVLLVAGVVVFIPALFTTAQDTMRQLGWVGLVGCVPLLISIFFPSVLNKLFSMGMKWIGRGEVSFHFAWYHIALMLVNDLLLWVIAGYGLYLLADSFSGLTLAQLPAVTGAMGFSWVLGTVSFLTPAGLGVREGAMGVLLSGILPVPLPALVAIVARFWWSLADFGSIGLAFLVFGRWGKKD
ncbi:MAG: flippase-like domain-containing protein [Anaerolineaceae bacterium]|nr:flippase-like domain-containing protein [Anaerolineaceae bacterium]